MRDEAGRPVVRRDAGNGAVPAAKEAAPSDVQRRLVALEKRIDSHEPWVRHYADFMRTPPDDGPSEFEKFMGLLLVAEWKTAKERLGKVAAELAELRNITLSSQDRAKARALGLLADIEAAAGRFASDPPAFAGAGPLTEGRCRAFARGPLDLGAFAPESGDRR